MNHKPKHNRTELFTTPELRERGWTPAIVRDMLGDPDDTRPNPRYSSTAGAMRLWRKERVEAVERTPEFRDRAEMARRRAERSRRAAEAMRQELKRIVEEIEITVTTEPLDDVTRDAIQSFNQRGQYREIGRGRAEWFERATEDSDPAFLDRITVNYLRHERTTYDDLWASLVGRVGRDEAHALLRGRVLHAIGAAYPALADECERQIADWEERHAEAKLDSYLL